MLREARESKGLSLEEVAKKVELPVYCLRDVEAGRRRLSRVTALQLGQFLDIPEDRLWQQFNESAAGQGSPAEVAAGGVGRRLRELREKKGLTLVELGRRARVSFTHVSEIERGNTCPSIKTLEKLASALGVPVGFLLSGDGCGSLGAKVRRLRERQGKTQGDLAAAIGTTFGFVAQVEADRTQPSLGTLEKLADALGVSPCYLLLKDEDLAFNMLSEGGETLDGDRKVRPAQRADGEGPVPPVAQGGEGLPPASCGLDGAGGDGACRDGACAVYEERAAWVPEAREPVGPAGGGEPGNDAAGPVGAVVAGGQPVQPAVRELLALASRLEGPWLDLLVEMARRLAALQAAGNERRQPGEGRSEAAQVAVLWQQLSPEAQAAAWNYLQFLAQNARVSLRTVG